MRVLGGLYEMFYHTPLAMVVLWVDSVILFIEQSYGWMAFFIFGGIFSTYTYFNHILKNNQRSSE